MLGQAPGNWDQSLAPSPPADPPPARSLLDRRHKSPGGVGCDGYFPYPRNSAYARNQPEDRHTRHDSVQLSAPTRRLEKAIPTIDGHRGCAWSRAPPAVSRVMTSFQWPGSFTPASTHQASCASISADDDTWLSGVKVRTSARN